MSHKVTLRRPPPPLTCDVIYGWPLIKKILPAVLKYSEYNRIIIFLGWTKNRWEDNIRMDLEEIGINAGNWVDSAQDMNYWRALVNAALNLRVP